MRLLLALVAPLAISAGGYNISNLPNGLYKVPIGDNGQINYGGASLINMTQPSRRRGRRSRPLRTSRDIIDIAYEDDDHDNEDDDDDDDYDGEFNATSDFGDNFGDNFGKRRCHSHFPHHHNRYITGHTMLNMDAYPMALSLFMEWMESGPDGGWLDRGEVRMAKTADLVVGACIYKRHKLRTCVHELSMAMDAADHECAAGKVGCHACMKNWHKDYFRFAASEAPNQCECAWYYWT